jgi:hypothetical protein
MATNVHFTQGTTNEQHLYEDLVIESLKIYGQDVYYIPREIVKRDRILEDDTVSRFDNAYRIEMYIENTEGFDGEGDLFTKFGIEIRDAATFIVARRRWQNSVARFENDPVTRPFYRPREGDLIYLTLSKSIFEITRVETEEPFYQLKNLPVFKMRCELFEYNDEDMDTGIEEIDEVESLHAYHTKLTVGSGLTFDVGEEIRQGDMRGEVAIYDDPTGILYVAHSGSTTGDYAEWTTTSAIVGQTNNTSVTPTAIGEDLQDGAQNSDFDTVGDGFLDFSESNPFGDPQ